jgi:hypothetical protein
MEFCRKALFIHQLDIYTMFILICPKVVLVLCIHVFVQNIGICRH